MAHESIQQLFDAIAHAAQQELSAEEQAGIHDGSQHADVLDYRLQRIAAAAKLAAQVAAAPNAQSEKVEYIHALLTKPTRYGVQIQYVFDDFATEFHDVLVDTDVKTYLDPLDAWQEALAHGDDEDIRARIAVYYQDGTVAHSGTFDPNIVESFHDIQLPSAFKYLYSR